MGNLIQASSSYFLFIFLGHVSKSNNNLGRLLIIVSVVSIFVIVIDNVSSQIVLQTLSEKSDREKSFAEHRFARHVLSLSATPFVALIAVVFDQGTAVLWVILYVSISLATIATTNVVFSSRAVSLGKSQTAMGVFQLVLPVTCFAFGCTLDLTFLAYVWAISKTLVAVSGEMFLGHFSQTNVYFWRTLQAKKLMPGGERENAIFVALTTVLNSISTQVDSILLSSIGAVSVAKYQFVSKPMQSFSVLNVSMSQFALRRRITSVSANLRRWSWLLAFVLFPLAAGCSGILLNVIAPAGLTSPIWLFAILGLANGFGFLASISGPKLLLLRRTRLLFASALAQLISFIITFAILVWFQGLGLLGCVLAVLISKASSFFVQSRA